MPMHQYAPVPVQEIIEGAIAALQPPLSLPESAIDWSTASSTLAASFLKDLNLLML